MISWQQVLPSAFLLAVGALLTYIGQFWLSKNQIRRDTRAEARKSLAEGYRRVARIRSLITYGQMITDNRAEEFNLSHACQDELDELSKLIFAGEKMPPSNAEAVENEARKLCADWQVAATHLAQPDKFPGCEDEIKELTKKIGDITNDYLDLLGKVWPRRGALPEEKKHNNCQQGGNQKEPKSFWNWLRHRHQTIALFLSAIALGFVGWQLYTTVQLAHEDRRAWVGVIEPTAAPEKGSPIKSIISITNTGRTPALQVETKVKYLLKEGGMQPLTEEELTIDEPYYTSRSAILPGENHRYVVEGNKLLTEDDMARINSGKMTIYLFGEINYTDSTGGEYKTTFAFFSVPSANGWGSMDTHNDMK